LTSSAIVPLHSIPSPNFAIRAAILLGTTLAIATTPAFAELRVRGSPQAVIIETQNTPVEEVLAALSRTFNMHYQSSVNLDKRLSRTYAGPLSRVLPRILDGYNFILKTDNGHIAVTVLGSPNAAGATAASSTPSVVRQPAEGVGAVQPRGAAEDLPRPLVSASKDAPAPVVELKDEPSFPTPARPSSGAAPAPVPELRQSEAAAPAPPVPGSKPTPAPEPGRPADMPPAAPTPPSASTSPQAK
jgi:hypothetical protein